MKDKILVLYGSSYAEAVIGLDRIIIDATHFFRRPEEFSLVLFTGGADITPEFYGDDSPKNVCWNNLKRDEAELVVFQKAFDHKIPMAGICRGVQFLNVMAGGKMMHDIQNHGGSRHIMQTNENEYFEVNSLHHQMILPPAGSSNAIAIGWCPRNLSRVYVGEHDKEVKYDGKEFEAAMFPAIQAFGVQYHPEMMSKISRGYVFFHEMVEMAIKAPWNEFVRKYGGDEAHADGIKICQRDSAAGE